MGIGIYVLFRNLSYLHFLAWIPLPEFAKKAFIPLPPSAFSFFVMYNLAGMLWFVSGIAFLRFVWFYRAGTQKVYVGSFYALGALIEISQLSERVSGTFDLLDLLFMGIGAFVEGLLYTIFVKRRMV